MVQQVIIVVNPYCHEGRGWKHWLSIKKEVLQSINVPVKEIVLEKGMGIDPVFFSLIQGANANCIISAGGDGSMNYLVNTLLKSSDISPNVLSIGAIGLGSSNDFLKPFSHKINKIPVKINYNGAALLHDVGLASYKDKNNNLRKRYFIVNASFGVTAAANWNFNNPDIVLQFLKKNSTSSAIVYTAIKTILTYKNQLCHLDFNSNEMHACISNINILKIPFVSGSFHYNQAIQPDDGRFALNICRDMNKIELLSTLHQLEKGRFENDSKRISTYTDALSLSSANPLFFECDGETEMVTDVKISIVPKAIRILKN
jgi:diacylglycerol kinase (ATP)